MPDLAKANWDEIVNSIKGISWENEFKKLTVDQSWDHLKDFLSSLSEKHIPSKNIKLKTRPIWMNKNAIRIVRKKAKLWRKYKQTKEYTDYMNYKNVEKETKREIKKIKGDFERNLAKDIKKNPKKFYAYIRSKCRTRDTVGPLMGQDGHIKDKEDEMCNILNDYFCSVFTESGTVDSSENSNVSVGTDLDDIFIDEDIVRKKIEKLREGKSPGPDGISTSMLIKTGDVIAKPLALIFNKSIKEGVVPKDWRVANVTPIFKKGKKNDPANYRPVSLTSVVCKLLESIIRDKMIEHLEKNRPLNMSQHGFMRHRSCLTNLLEFFEKVLDKIDKGLPVDVI